MRISVFTSALVNIRITIPQRELYRRQYFQATKDCLTREYSFEDGNGGSRDQYLADNNINTFIITGFSDQEIENNNKQEKTLEMEVDVKTDSPVLTVENLPKVCTNQKILQITT